ncbi:hypothetical protein KGF57_000049 [Candida theae]|uniref:AB hydrolase-1 domain-containing protein n=1 Tax=Candida theae TaxID=1198502 RepID=A0AAD5BLE5_9ASCO|nr:uncharacterized protein KGF57_000049 [Candida theae]KAI5968934.1 hypothetical protein KGF57_000049 [Candida theae]
MALNKHEIKLHNDGREFSTLSNLPLSAIDAQDFDRVIMLLHGFPDINTTFNQVWPILLSRFNEKVLLVAPKLRGYEKSSIGPEHEYMLPYLAGDVKGWIHELNPQLDKPVHLVGHDWGAIVAFKTANLYPDLITSMVTLAIPYLVNIRSYELLWHVPQQFYLSSYFITMQFPWLYKAKLTESNDYLTSLWRYWSPDYNVSQEEITEVRDAFKKDGVVDAVTAYYRHLFRPLSLIKSRWPVDFEKVPTLILNGANDQCMSSKIAVLEQEKLKKFYPKAQVKVVPQVGHFLQREAPEVVAGLIADFLESI